VWPACNKQKVKGSVAAQRQRVLDQIAEHRRLEEEERLRLVEKKKQCHADLTGQMDYEWRKRKADKAEEERMIEKQKEAEKLLNAEIDELLVNPVAFKLHPLRRRHFESLKHWIINHARDGLVKRDRTLTLMDSKISVVKLVL
jgi:hypothetical protein